MLMNNSSGFNLRKKTCNRCSFFICKKKTSFYHNIEYLVYFNYKYLFVYILIIDILRNYHWVTYKKKITRNTSLSKSTSSCRRYKPIKVF